ncbi:MAG: TetR/AcrR family transcriptional regulator [Lachnospiraceae bacterium]|nr:TetR/AcrR family transcriptional regulator [Lachnospiraceae bacterium]
MANDTKYTKILDALQKLLEAKDIKNISVSEIARAAEMGKGSLYYYFPSKEAILEALVERDYAKPLETAKKLASKTDISPFTRMAMIFQACRNSSVQFRSRRNAPSSASAPEQAFIHQKYLTYLTAELKPVLTDIIWQGVQAGEIHFEYPAALAEIVLIVLAVKLDNTLAPSTPEETDETILGLIALLEKGTENPAGSLNFLRAI